MSTRFKVSTLEIAGFASVLAALRLPFGKEMRSKADWQVSMNNNILFQSSISIDPKDLTLMSTLVKRGDEHAKAINDKLEKGVPEISEFLSFLTQKIPFFNKSTCI